MITLKRATSEDKDFTGLVKLLDMELADRYGKLQSAYDEFNKINFTDKVVIAYYDNQPAGCGCFKKYDSMSVEIKRMFVKPEFRGKGISKLILVELENWAREKDYIYSILETGSNQPEAVGLYKKSGYIVTENYGPYVNMNESICFKKYLAYYKYI